MKHNFFIVSSDKVTIDAEIDKILKNVPKEREIIKYDMDDTLISTVVLELDTYNFLSSCKVVICYNFNFMEKEDGKEFRYIKDYLANFNDNYLIMISSELSDKKQIRDILSNVEIINTKISSFDLIKKNLDGFLMDNNTINYFVNYCLENNEKIINELNKIKVYKYSDPDKTITNKDIDMLVLKDYDEDIFSLVNAIAKKDKINMFSIYSRLITKEKDTVNLVASIASQVRLLYSVKVLSDAGLNINEMATIINVKPRAISIAMENSCNFSTKRLLKLLNELTEIDYKTKSSNISGNILLKIFLLNV